MAAPCVQRGSVPGLQPRKQSLPSIELSRRSLAARPATRPPAPRWAGPPGRRSLSGCDAGAARNSHLFPRPWLPGSLRTSSLLYAYQQHQELCWGVGGGPALVLTCRGCGVGAVFALLAPSGPHNPDKPALGACTQGRFNPSVPRGQVPAGE